MMMTDSIGATTLTDELFKPGRIRIEPVEGCLFVTKSGTEIGEIFMDDVSGSFILMLVEGYVVPCLRYLLILHPDLDEAIKIASRFIDRIDDYALRGDVHGTVH